MKFAATLWDDIAGPMTKAFEAMDALEAGAIANPDENRMVGHYWLRDAARAPESEITEAIKQAVSSIKSFATDVHNGAIAPPTGGRFTRVLQIGIGGSALGPQFVADALGQPDDPMQIHFIDNTDPDGIDRIIAQLGDRLKQTLCLVVSKSGGTKETRNGMLEVAHAYQSHGLNFAKCAVAVTGEGSALDNVCKAEGWLRSFPMWDWIGGRTSQMSAVGLLPAALSGIDIDQLLAGAKAMDACTRRHELQENPSALLAAMWFDAARSRGLRNMVVIPYKDRLSLLSRYLQQLIMESIGKEFDLDGNVVEEGISVYGNKGSTDQHAYVQQLRDGVNNFYATFVEVLRDRSGSSIDVDESVKSGDYLAGFLLGTREALTEKERESITIQIDEVNPNRIGALIALYERAVGLYASLVHVNAYHQPGVEAGKRAATEVLEVQLALHAYLGEHPDEAFTAEELADRIAKPDRVEWVSQILNRLAYNGSRGVAVESDINPTESRYCFAK